MNKPLTMTPEREAEIRRLVDEDRWQVDPGHVYNGLEAMLDEVDALRARLAEAEGDLRVLAPFARKGLNLSVSWYAPEFIANLVIQRVEATP